MVYLIKRLPSNEPAVDVDGLFLLQNQLRSPWNQTKDGAKQRETDNTVRNDFIYYKIITNDAL
jgi:hypothetical protein